MAENFTLEEMGSLWTYPNLAQDDLIDDEALTNLGRECMEGYEIDVGSIAEWKSDVEEVRKIAAQETEDKTYPWVGASNVKYPLITSSAYQFNARSYATILNNNNPALARVVGADPDGEKLKRANRVSQHMSYQLIEDMNGWEADMDRLLLSLPIDGTVFKKVYHDSIEGKNVAEYVSATDLVVNNATKDLRSAPRISMVFSLYPYEVQEMINSELFREWREEERAEQESENQEPIEFVEQHVRYDLDGDGYPEPYIVTFTKDSGEVVRVTANFRAEDIVTDGDEIAKIVPTQYYVKYECFPDPDGGFYSRGFGMLLKPVNDSIDSILNQLIDAGHLSNTGGGFIGNNLRIKSGQLRFSPGEWKKVDVGGSAIRDSVFPLPVPDPSPVLFNLLGVLMEAGKDISSIQDVMTGGGGQNTPATTVLAQIEQGMKVYTAIFKRIYRSLKEELNLLYNLNRLYLEDETYRTILDEDGAISRQDYEDESMDIRPAADPTMATDIQKAAKAQILAGFMGNPIFNQYGIAEEILKSAGFDDVEKYINPPPQGPSPEEQLMMQQEAARIEMENREQTRKEMETAAKIEEMETKKLQNLSAAAKNVADADEKGSDASLNIQELEIAKETVNDRRRLPTVEGIE